MAGSGDLSRARRRTILHRRAAETLEAEPAAREPLRIGLHYARAGVWDKAAVHLEHTARELRNTPAICRKSYIHPAVIESYLSGRLQQAMRGRTEAAGLIRVLESRGNGHRVQARTLRPRRTGTRHAHTGGTLYTARSGVRRYQRELSTGPSGR